MLDDYSIGAALRVPLLAIAVSMLAWAINTPARLHANDIEVHNLLDLSGLAWIGGDQFLGVHDAKDTPEKRDWPRLSLLRLPQSEDRGIVYRPIDVKFPVPEGRPNDLESACRLPDGKGFLLCESGQEGVGDRHIFHAVFHDGKLQIKSFTRWPVKIKNVEGTEVCRIGEQLIFLYAERADSEPSTELRWCSLSLDPWKFGPFSQVKFTCPDPTGKGARPIAGMDVDDDGEIYIVAAHDPGSDDGPYRSVVWWIGRLESDQNGSAQITLRNPERMATLDGLKVESIAIRQSASGNRQVFVGSDDEHYGGILRPLPSRHRE